MSERLEKVMFGDFQTPVALAEAVCQLLLRSGIQPGVIIEPSCGEGSFLEAAVRSFGRQSAIFGFDINPEYVAAACRRMANYTDCQAQIQTADFFRFDWERLLVRQAGPVLFLGNPPWVTNAALGVLDADNLPQKSNLKNLSGLEARTGKANFDISEWMLIKMAEAAGKRPFAIAMLCKTNVARKALEYYWKNSLLPQEAALYRIDAAHWFGAAVDACLFVAHFNTGAATEKNATLYESLDVNAPATRFGVVDGEMVSHVDDYRELSHLNGVNYYRWRSGVKHDLAKVMELDWKDGGWRNGLGDAADVEQERLYPLLKATDVAKGTITPTKRIVMTQTAVGQDTRRLQDSAPKMWRYLERYATLFAARKSSIYRKQPPFCLFGVGAYTFAPFKVAISGLHKDFRFTLVPPCDGKPVCFDDTGYFIGCEEEREAKLLHTIFNSELVRRFLRAVTFAENKRPITADILNRIDVKKVAEELGLEQPLIPFLYESNAEMKGQGRLVFETKRSTGRKLRNER